MAAIFDVVMKKNRQFFTLIFPKTNTFRDFISLYFYSLDTFLRNYSTFVNLNCFYDIFQ